MSSGKSVIICVVVSGCYAPIVHFALSNKYWSQKYTMLFLDYFLFLISFVVFVGILQPCADFWNFEKRGSVFYFSCCMFTCIAVNQFTLNAVRYQWVKVRNSRIDFFYDDEPYIRTPHGICSEMWQCVTTFSLALLMVSKMESGSSPRNLALYWCGATFTNEIVTAFGLILGTHRKQTKYSSFVHYFYLPFAVVVLHHFLVSKHRIVRKRTCSKTKFPTIDIFLIVVNAMCMLFHVQRCISIFDLLLLSRKSRSAVQSYARFYEPYMSHKSYFGLSWVLLTAVTSIPCHIIAIRCLNYSDTSKGMGLAMMHAGSTLQGTLVYLSYDFISISERRFRIPAKNYTFVMMLNILLVCTTHCYMLRCLWAVQLEKMKEKIISKNKWLDVHDSDDEDSILYSPGYGRIDHHDESEDSTSLSPGRARIDHHHEDEDLVASQTDSEHNWYSSDSDNDSDDYFPFD